MDFVILVGFLCKIYFRNVKLGSSRDGFLTVSHFVTLKINKYFV